MLQPVQLTRLGIEPDEEFDVAVAPVMMQLTGPRTLECETDFERCQRLNAYKMSFNVDGVGSARILDDLNQSTVFQISAEWHVAMVYALQDINEIYE